MTAIRYAWRSLARSPGFVVIAILALGLGLGLSTTMFAVLDAVVNPHVPYRAADRLFNVSWRLPPRVQGITSADLYRTLRDDARSFAEVAPAAAGALSYESGAESREIQVAHVAPRYFGVMGAKPRLGRVFTEADGDDAIVLGQALWRREFGLRRSVEGATITLGDRTYRVLGVLPRGATHPFGYTEAWIPAPPGHEEYGRFQPVVRLQDGMTIEAASEELAGLARLLTERHDTRGAPLGFNLYPVTRREERLRDIHVAMVGSALVVLIIACVNLAHLMLARGLAKRREFALRMAVGASRAAVVRQMFTECALITAAGAALGGVLALWGADLLTNRMPSEVSWVGLIQPQLSWRVFTVAAAAAASAAVLFGLLPAIRVALDVDVGEPLKDGAGTTGRLRHRYSPLVIAEVALALVLMMGGALLLRTVQQLQKEEFGFDTRTLQRSYVMTQMRQSPSDTATPRVRREDVLAAVQAVPGVLDAAFVGNGAPRSGALTAEMVYGDSTRTLNMRTFPVVSASYLRTLGLPILAGRNFEPGDASGAGVAILDPIAAQRLYPRQDPVGKMIKLGAPAADAPWIPIIGVARNPMVLEGRDVHPEPQVWVTRPATVTSGTLVIRTVSRDARVAVEIRRRLVALPGVRGIFMQPYAYQRDATLASRAFLARVFVAMGAVALALAALGLYGVLAYAVGQRMREFAVRIALGAEASQLFRMVLHDGAVMLLAGTGIGAFAALAATKYLDAVLEGIYRTDVLSLAAAELVLIAVGLAAALAPARRAVKANPLDILRAV